jgi:tetratricopeptide (TPR) repeat protein
LRDWDSALNCLRKATQRTHTNPLVHLTVVRFYTLQAEYQYLCQSCNVLRHSPGPESISESALRGARNALASLHEVFNGWQNQLEQIGLPTKSTLVDRWQARAEMIFEKHNQVAEAFHRLASIAQDQADHPYLYNPDDTAAMIAASRRQNGQIDEKANLASLFQTVRKQSPHPTLLLQVAISLTGHHPLEALNASQLSIKNLDQDRCEISALCHYYQAYLYLQQGMLPEAQEKLDIALGIWGDEPRWNAMAAEIKNQTGDTVGAIRYLEEAVKYEPKNVKHHLALGHTYLNGISTNTEADVVAYQKCAISNFERATRLAPQDPDVWLVLSQAQYQIGDLMQAEKCVDQVLEIDPNNYGALSMKAEIALRSGDPDRACDYAKRAASQQPDHPAAHLIHARALESLSRPEEALQALEKALPNSDTPLSLKLEHAGLVKQLQGAQAAIEELKSIARQFPGDPDVFAHLARAYAECDEEELAIQSAQISLISGRGILSEPDQAQMHHLLGRLLRKTGQLDQAILHLHNAAQIIPDDVEPYLELGIAHKERREYQQALQLFQQATTIATHDPRPFYLAGLALKEGKDYRQSEVMLRKAANLAPQDVNIRRQLAAVVALNLVHNPTTVRANAE